MLNVVATLVVDYFVWQYFCGRASKSDVQVFRGEKFLLIMSPRKILLSNDQWDMCDMKESLAIGFCVHGYHVCNDIVAAVGGELPWAAVSASNSTYSVEKLEGRICVCTYRYYKSEELLKERMRDRPEIPSLTYAVLATWQMRIFKRGKSVT